MLAGNCLRTVDVSREQWLNGSVAGVLRLDVQQFGPCVSLIPDVRLQPFAPHRQRLDR
jgi:hypothetical protein